MARWSWTALPVALLPRSSLCNAQLPPECVEFATCAQAGAQWQEFRHAVQQAAALEAANQQAAMELYFQLMQRYTLDAGMALQCRMGSASVFYRLGRMYLGMGYSQRAANLFQLAMSMFWDTSRSENGMACLQHEMWGVRWFEDFMETYLSNAARIRRNDLAMLPHLSELQVPDTYRDPNLSIGVFSLCDYSPESPMAWLLQRSRRNRQAYCSRHGYGLEWTSERPGSSKDRHPVWGQIAGPLELINAGKYDWILSMDCDSLFVDLTVTVDSLLYRFASRATPWGKLELDPEVHFLISEDGRGLAGGNWIVRNSPEGRAFLSEVYGPGEEAKNPYMRHDLRDQFSLLWHLVRPGVGLPLPPEAGGGSPASWAAVGYLPLVRLVPQDMLLGSYPFVSCSQPGDQAHRCFEESRKFIVSIPLLGALPQQLAQAVLDRFLLESLGTLDDPVYEQQLRGMCATVDISQCLVLASIRVDLPSSPAFAWAQQAQKPRKADKDKDRFDGSKKRPERAVRSKSLAELLAEEEAGKGPKLEEALLAVFQLIDADCGGSISKLELIGAVYRHALVASFVLQGHDINVDLRDANGQVSINEYSFDAIDDIFESMSGGSSRVKYMDFASHFRRAAAASLAAEREQGGMREIFRQIDADGDGAISKLELVAAIQRDKRVSSYLLPGINPRVILEDEASYDAVCALFDQMAAGRQRIRWLDFKNHCLTARFPEVFDSTPSHCGSPQSCPSPQNAEKCDRSKIRVLVLGPGFGRERNPHQAAMLVQAGFQLHWVRDLQEFPDDGARLTYHLVAPHLPKIRDEIQRVRPSAVLCASQGGAYLVGLWQLGFWQGPSIMLNCHPSLPMRLPGAQIVLAHGSNDESYLWRREDLEDLVCTGAPNKCFLYYTANSGYLASGSLTRLGDRHAMQSILTHDCLPRLIEAAVSPQGPEMHMLHSWRQQLGEQRLEAQHWLGYSLERLRRLWASPGRQGCAEQKLFPVPQTSEEYRKVAAIFKAEPPEPPAYMLSSQASWEQLPIIKIERIEHGCQLECSAMPYRDGLRKSLKEQGLDFEASVHGCWAFHGADSEALGSVIRDVSGFQPLISGSRNSPVWGSGTYFARDAKYVADGQFCPRRPDGLRCMLLCLVTLGMPCLGDPQQKGVLPFRQKPHRYNSTVDSLSSPEVYVVQHAGAAHPAYLITFA
ncbi:unnamed protein product [Effrenium voratum]|uniref:EF-hand domain-containing protein n=1 Tax=Effrenium voratum TaxID=2562239 RepID=A0AA36MPQ3_9DINO|nr:unnamed protein product [Effrenium voratum]